MFLSQNYVHNEKCVTEIEIEEEKVKMLREFKSAIQNLSETSQKEKEDVIVQLHASEAKLQKMEEEKKKLSIEYKTKIEDIVQTSEKDTEKVINQLDDEKHKIAIKYEKEINYIKDESKREKEIVVNKIREASEKEKEIIINQLRGVEVKLYKAEDEKEKLSIECVSAIKNITEACEKEKKNATKQLEDEKLKLALKYEAEIEALTEASLKEETELYQVKVKLHKIETEKAMMTKKCNAKIEEIIESSEKEKKALSKQFKDEKLQLIIEFETIIRNLKQSSREEKESLISRLINVQTELYEVDKDSKITFCKLERKIKELKDLEDDEKIDKDTIIRLKQEIEKLKRDNNELRRRRESLAKQILKISADIVKIGVAIGAKFLNLLPLPKLVHDAVDRIKTKLDMILENAHEENTTSPNEDVSTVTDVQYN